MTTSNPGGESRLEKPCLVETSQGFSVSYKNRFLYSKYAPKRAIVQAVQSMTFLPNTLILCASPVLWHGLSEILEKAGDGCIVLGIETDRELFRLAQSELEKFKAERGGADGGAKCRVEMLPIDEIRRIVEIMTGKAKSKIDFPKPHTLKRAVMVEMSGGTAFDRDFYREIAAAAENAVASFWKNRITLTKLGRLFSKNLLDNISSLPDAGNGKEFFGRIGNPIVVFGAGEGTQKLLDDIDRRIFERMCVVAVDAAVPSLKANGVRIDFIAAVEAQLAIEKAYIGGGAADSIIFADMASRPAVTRHDNKGVCFFASEFADTNFFRRVTKEDFFPAVVPPLGSVGLTATYLALLLRKDQSVPVFVTGLDFSYSLGATHTKGAPQTIQRQSTCDKLHPAENYEAAFKAGAQRTVGKDGAAAFTDIALYSYARNFQATFEGQRNLFDIGKSGLDLGLIKIDASGSDFWNMMSNFPKFSLPKQKCGRNTESAKKILDFLENEEKSLERIKELLIYGKDVEKCGRTVESELWELITDREYLFLHFPDGHSFDAGNISQLKRIRGEADFFLKTIRNGIRRLRPTPPSP